MFETSTFLAESLGYLAAATVLLAFSLKSIVSLRVVAILSNVLFIIYALATHIMPVLALHALLLPMNIVRFWQLLHLRPVVHTSRSNCMISQR